MAPSGALLHILALASGLALAIFLTPVVLVLREMSWCLLMQQRYFRLARQRGNFAEAVLVSKDCITAANPDRRDYYTCRYTYEVEGKTYTYRSRSDCSGTIPERLDLYYLRSPRRAAPFDRVGLRETSLGTVVLIYVVTALLVTQLLILSPPLMAKVLQIAESGGT